MRAVAGSAMAAHQTTPNIIATRLRIRSRAIVLLVAAIGELRFFLADVTGGNGSSRLSPTVANICHDGSDLVVFELPFKRWHRWSCRLGRCCHTAGATENDTDCGCGILRADRGGLCQSGEKISDAVAIKAVTGRAGVAVDCLSRCHPRVRRIERRLAIIAARQTLQVSCDGFQIIVLEMRAGI